MAFRYVYSVSLLSMMAAFFLAPPMVSAQSSPESVAMLQRRIDPVVPNFGVVDSVLSRGGQPKKNGLRALKDAGFKTVINLRDGEDDIDDEREVADNLKLNYISIPMSAFKKPSSQQIQQFFNIVNAPENQPVFLHCRQGKDRTGAMVAMYRMAKHGWSPDQAHSEMLRYGFHQIFAGLTKSVYEFDGAGGSSSIEAPREAGD